MIVPDENTPKTLLELAVAKFGKLEGGEAAVMREVRDGGIARFVGRWMPRLGPGLPRQWNRARMLRAEVLEWLLTNEKAKQHISHNGLRIIGARIGGTLDFSFAELNFPLWLDQCSFEMAPFFPCATIGLLSLDGSHLPGLTANGMKVMGDVLLGDGFRAKGEVSLSHAEIRVGLNCEGGRFENRHGNALVCNGMTVGGEVRLGKGFHAKGEVHLLDVQIGELICTDGRFENPGGCALNFDGAMVAGTVFLRNRFDAEGEVRLVGANIRGQLACDNGRFANPGKDDEGNARRALTCDGAKVAGSVFLRNHFHATGSVWLRGAEIGGQLNCTGGRFENPGGNALAAQGIVVKGATVLGQEEAIGSGGVEILGMADFSDGTFEQSFVWVQEGKPQDTMSVPPEASKRLSNPGKLLVNATLVLRNAKVGTLRIGKKVGEELGGLELHGLVYNSIGEGMETGSDWWKKLLGERRTVDSRHWLRRCLMEAVIRIGTFLYLGPRPSFPIQPYEQAAKVLREQGHADTARDILISKEMRHYGTMPHFRSGYGFPDWLQVFVGVELLSWGTILVWPYFREVLRGQAPNPSDGLFAAWRLALGPEWVCYSGAVIFFLAILAFGPASLRRLGHWCSGLLIDYGHRPVKAGRYAGGWILLAWGLAHWGYHEGMIVPVNARNPLGIESRAGHVAPAPKASRATDPAAPEEFEGTPVQWNVVTPRGYPEFEPFVFAVETFTPLVKLGQKDYWHAEPFHPSGVLLRYFFWLTTLGGWAITTLLVAALTGVLKK